jgi:hypothetical protein
MLHMFVFTLALVSILASIIPVAAHASFNTFDYPGPVNGPQALIGTEVWKGNENGTFVGITKRQPLLMGLLMRMGLSLLLSRQVRAV